LAEINNEARRLANADDAESARLSAGRLLAAGSLIGLFLQDPQTWLAGDTEGFDDALIDRLIDERTASRKQKNFARADEIRDQLQEMGISLEDVADGTRWRRSSDS
jgi:cysteinyl-tRNA synthetase